MEFLLFIVILAAMLFASAVLLDADPREVFDIRRHQWLRDLRTDYRTSREQFWSDWDLFKAFARRNAPWMYAGGCGMLGLLLAGIVLIKNIPDHVLPNGGGEQSTAGVNDASDFVIDTRTAAQGSVGSVDVPVASWQLPPDSVLSISVAAGLRSSVPATLVSAPTVAPDVDPDVAFSEFAPLSAQATDSLAEPKREDVGSQALEIELERQQISDEPTEDFTVHSVPVLDIDDSLARLRSDDWVPSGSDLELPADALILFSERHLTVPAAQDEIDEPIRIRPRAAGGAASPGLRVATTMPTTAVVGGQLRYEIELSNPADEPVPMIIVEEVLPGTWDLIDAAPICELSEDNILRWEIKDLGAGRSVRLAIHVRVGHGETTRARTIVTAGAAVEATVDVADDIEPEIDPPPVAKSEVIDWEPSGALRPELPAPAPEITPVVHRAEPELELEMTGSARATPGDVRLQFTVKNVGTLTVDNARVMVWLADALQHPKGNRIARRVPVIPPGETRVLTLNVRARRDGHTISRVELRSGDVVFDRGEAKVEIRTVGAVDSPARGWQGRETGK